MLRSATRALALLSAAALAAIVLVAAAGAVAASENDDHAGFTTTVFATGGPIPGGTVVSKPDDITQLDGRIFVSWQNGVGPKGEPAGTVTSSTVVEYSRSGAVIHSWQLTGRCDGLSADPEHNRLIATVNEDGNSSLYVIRPEADAASQLKHYTYSPNPPAHGGGTDAPHVYRGQILISASNPQFSSAPAVYRVTLSGTTASLTTVFTDDASAIVANTNDPAHGTTVQLALSDPDSNNVVPRSSPRFAGDFLLDSQGDGQHIYIHDAGTARQTLYLLNLSSPSDPSTAVDDTVWTTSSDGTLYATDGSSHVYAIRGDFRVGTAFSAVSPANANTPSIEPNWLATLNLNTGFLNRVTSVTIHPKGLIFVNSSDGGDD